MPKLHLIRQALHLRRRRPEWFGPERRLYARSRPRGPKPDHVVAFAAAAGRRLHRGRASAPDPARRDGGRGRPSSCPRPWLNELTGEEVAGGKVGVGDCSGGSPSPCCPAAANEPSVLHSPWRCAVHSLSRPGAMRSVRVGRIRLGAEETAMIAPDPLWYKDAIIYELHVKAFCRQQRRRHRRLPRPDRQARLSPGPGDHLPLAPAVLPVAACATTATTLPTTTASIPATARGSSSASSSARPTSAASGS